MPVHRQFKSPENRHTRVGADLAAAVGMSRPRLVLPNTTHLITRRCTQRQFLLRPSKRINQFLAFCLALAAERYGILVHAFCFLSNHWHAVLTDIHGNLPEFCRWFHEFAAKGINAMRDRRENLWASGSYSDVLLLDEGAELGEALYTLTNPVKDGLVARGHHWPGLRSKPTDVGKSFTIRRPHWFFRADGSVPEEATLRITKLPSLAHLSDEDYASTLTQAVEAEEQRLREAVRGKGRSFLGRRGVLAQRWWDRPSGKEPAGRLSPRLACKNRRRRAAGLKALREFVRAYREARRAYREGKRDVAFPPGTYWLRLYVGVSCSDHGSPGGSGASWQPLRSLVG
jgi:REP element-mobilizing transposase RayT